MASAYALLIRGEVGRRDWVDLVKGTAIILIIAYHITLFLYSIGWDVAGIGRIKIILELFPMAAFFVITGTFHARVGAWSFADLWRRRLRQYLYLYVLWSVIRFLFYLVAPNVRSDGAGTSAADPLALLGVLFWPISSYWFIYALFIFTAVLWLFRKMPPWVLIGLSAALSMASSSGILDVNNVGINRMSEYLVFFVLGAYFNRRIYSAMDTMKPWKAVALAAGFGLFGVVITLLPVLQRVPGVAFIGQVLAIITGFAIAYYAVRLTALNWVSYVGQRTLNIYLVHLYIIAILVVPLTLFPGLNFLPGRGLIVTAVLTVLTVVLSILLTRYLTRITWLFVYPWGRKKTKARIDDAESATARAKASDQRAEIRPKESEQSG